MTIESLIEFLSQEMTVTETFAKQLLQFSGMTAEKALALTQIYNTPSRYM